MFLEIAKSLGNTKCNDHKNNAWWVIYQRQTPVKSLYNLVYEILRIICFENNFERMVFSM